MKNHPRFTYVIFALILGGGVFFAWFSQALAAYLPGATLDPQCAPTDASCTVITPLAGIGSIGSLAYWFTTTTVSSTPLLFWDSTNSFMGIGTSQPSSALQVVGTTNLQGLIFSNATSTGWLTAGTASATSLWFTNATGSSASTLFVATASTTGLLFNNATGTGWLTSTYASHTSLFFTNATGSSASTLWVNALTVPSITLASATGTSATSSISIGNLLFGNATSTGWLTAGTASATSLWFTNATGSSASTLFVNTASTTNLLFNSATGSANSTLFVNTASATNIWFTNATGTGNLLAGTVSSTNLWFTNATGTALTLQATGTQALLLSGSPKLSTSTSIVQLGIAPIQLANVAGTWLGANPSSFAGDFLNFQVNSSTQFDVSATGTLTVAGVVSSTGIVFLNATSTGWLTVGNASATNLWFTNATSASATGWLTVGNASATKLFFTNATGTALTLQATGTQALLLSGSPQTSTSTSFVQLGINPIQLGAASGTWLGMNPVSFTGDFLNFQVNSSTQFGASATGLLRAVGATFSGIPPASTSTSLLQLGPTPIQLANVSGTYLGANPSSFAGDFLNFQVNSSTQFDVSATGTLTVAGVVSSTGIVFLNATSTGWLTVGNASATNLFFANATGTGNFRAATATIMNTLSIATTSFWSATTTLVVCARSNCSLPTTSTDAVAVFSSPNASTTGISIITKGGIASGQADIGEYISVVGDRGSYRGGDVLSISTSEPGKFEKSSVPYDSNLAGVVTETAGLIAGGGEDNHGSVVIALQGRIQVKVTGENGPIVVGDYLTSSDVPGYAEKAVSAGRVVAIAMQAFSGTTASDKGQILAFVEKSYYPGINISSFGSSVVGQNLQGGTNTNAISNQTMDQNMVYSFANLRVQNLTIGSAEKPTGFTIYDVMTKQPLCVEAENGTLVTVPGVCSSGAGGADAATPPSSTGSNSSVLPPSSSPGDSGQIIDSNLSANLSTPTSTDTDVNGSTSSSGVAPQASSSGDSTVSQPDNGTAATPAGSDNSSADTSSTP